MKKNFILVFLSSMLLVACQPSKITTGILDVKDAWARPALKGDNGAVYLVIANGTLQDDQLLFAQSDIASTVEVHQSQMEGDQMSMHQQEEVLIPAGEAVKFSPGGLHIMLADLTRELTTSETFDITLAFEHAGEIKVMVTVKDNVNDD